MSYDYMTGKGLFIDEDRLSPRYIPKRLPHREEQLNLLRKLFDRSLKQPGKVYYKTVEATGGVGTGKTCTALTFGSTLEGQAKAEGIELKHIYTNLKLEAGTRFVLYANLLEKAAPEIPSRSLSPEEMLRELLKYLKKQNLYLFLTFDEVDYYTRKSKEDIVYDFTRLNELYPREPINIVGMIIISRNPSWRDQLEPSEQSTLGRNVVHFYPYTSAQIKDIMEERIQEAFEPNAVPEDIIDFVADVSSKPPVSGDIRYALDLIFYAGKIAENNGCDTIAPEHVRQVYGETFHTLTTEDILNLPSKERYILLAIASSLKHHKTPYVSLKNIRESYSLIVEEHKQKPVNEIEEHVQDLSDRGIIDIKSLTQIGICGVPAETLAKFLDNFIQRVKHLEEK